MGRLRIDERGRITIPKDFRQELGLFSGDAMVFERIEGGIIVRKLRTKKEVFRKLRGIVTRRNSVGRSAPEDLRTLLRTGIEPNSPNLKGRPPSRQASPSLEVPASTLRGFRQP